MPNQALFREEEREWVLVQDGGDLVRREVRLGLRGPTARRFWSGLRRRRANRPVPAGEDAACESF